MEFVIIVSGIITMGFILILCIEGWNFKIASYCMFFLCLTIFSGLSFTFYQTEKTNTYVSDSLQINDIIVKFGKPMTIKEIYKKPFLAVSKYGVTYTISEIEKK